MPDFIANILIGVKQWVEGKLEDMSYVISSHINELHNTKLEGVTFNGTSATVTNNVAAITANVGVTSVSAGVGLVTSDGNAITSTGTVKAKLKSESPVNLTSTLGDTAGRQYAVELDTDGYLSVNVPWTDNNDNTTYTFAEGTTEGAFQVTPSGGNAQAVNVHNVLKSSGGTLTGQVYYSSAGAPVPTTAVSCSQKYNWLSVTADTTLTITAPSSLSGACEVIYAIKNSKTTGDIILSLPSTMTGGTVYNMTNTSSFTISPGQLVELVFTFWNPGVVTFNGGLSA